MIYTVVLIPGDGIGPEVTDAARRVLRAAEAPIEFVEHHPDRQRVPLGQRGAAPDAQAVCRGSASATC